MKLKCYIVDNEQYFIDVLKKYVLSHGALELVGHETRPSIALDNLLNGVIKADVTFLDILMPGMTGLEFAARLKGICRVVFITSDKNFALESYEKDGIDFIVKPITKERFYKAVEKVQRWYDGKGTAPKYLPINEGKGHTHLIPWSEIVFIESKLNYIEVTLENRKVIVGYSSLTAVEEQLKGGWFFRVHRAYVVSLHHVLFMSNNNLTMLGDHKIKIGPTYRTAFLERLRESTQS